jgi:hypothetical protein
MNRGFLMEKIEAIALQEKWGSKECKHRKIEKECLYDIHTGDYVCVKCGKSGLYGSFGSWRKNDG